MKVFVEFVNWFLPLYLSLWRKLWSALHFTTNVCNSFFHELGIVIHDGNVHQINHESSCRWDIFYCQDGGTGFRQLGRSIGWRAWQISVVTQFWTGLNEWLSMKMAGACRLIQDPWHSHHDLHDIDRLKCWSITIVSSTPHLAIYITRCWCLCFGTSWQCGRGQERFGWSNPYTRSSLDA